MKRFYNIIENKQRITNIIPSQDPWTMKMYGGDLSYTDWVKQNKNADIMFESQVHEIDSHVKNY